MKTIIFLACLLATCCLDVGAQNSSALKKAISKNDPVAAQKAIDAGANVNYEDRHESTPLIWAIYNPFRQQLAVIKTLIANKANVNFGKGKPLRFAIKYGHLAIVKLLLESGADPNLQIEKKYSSSYSMMGNRRSTTNKSALLAAIQGEQHLGLDLLLKYGANANLANDGYLPLNEAVEGQNYYAVAQLLKKGANKSARDGRNKTALQIAQKHKNSEMINLLKTGKLTAKRKKLYHYQFKHPDFKRFQFFTYNRYALEELHKYPIKTLDGKTVTLTDFKGKIVFLNVWATWCGPCLREIPAIVKLQKALKGTPFVVLAVSMDKKLETLKKDQVYRKLPFIVAHDPTSALRKKRLFGSLPSTHIFDQSGKHVAMLNGSFDWSKPVFVEFFKSLIK